MEGKHRPLPMTMSGLKLPICFALMQKPASQYMYLEKLNKDRLPEKERDQSAIRSRAHHSDNHVVSRLYSASIEPRVGQ